MNSTSFCKTSLLLAKSIFILKNDQTFVLSSTSQTYKMNKHCALLFIFLSPFCSLSCVSVESPPFLHRFYTYVSLILGFLFSFRYQSKRHLQKLTIRKLFWSSCNNRFALIICLTSCRLSESYNLVWKHK